MTESSQNPVTPTTAPVGVNRVAIRENRKQADKIEKLGKIIEKQFKKEIRSTFGQHMPKEFVKTMVNNRNSQKM